MQGTITYHELQGAPVAHTDTGDFVYLGGQPCKEVYVRGKISRARAGLFFIDIEGKKHSCHKQAGFAAGEEVICICNPIIKEGKVEGITIRSLEKQ